MPRGRPLWMSCFCADAEATLLEKYNYGLVGRIRSGDVAAAERALRKWKKKHNNEPLTVVVKRRYQPPNYQCEVDRCAACPFETFFQESNPVLWAIDCQQTELLPLFQKYGFDPNKPTPCLRYRCMRSSVKYPSTSEHQYGTLWTHGRYTYQSALDYYLANVYEFSNASFIPTIGETSAPLPEYRDNPNENPLCFYFSNLPELLRRGVDVHRIDSVVFFNLLATNLTRYLSNYYDSSRESESVADLPHAMETIVELHVVESLIQHGFSQFECLDFASPCYNFLGILFCLLCHPKMRSALLANSTTPSLPIPPSIRRIALLLINLLSLGCKLPNKGDYEEQLEYLQFRKIYSKRYTEHREAFQRDLRTLHADCLHARACQPFPLKMLARMAIRRQLGGIHFIEKVSSLPISAQLGNYLSYISARSLHGRSMMALPEVLLSLAMGLEETAGEKVQAVF